MNTYPDNVMVYKERITSETPRGQYETVKEAERKKEKYMRVARNLAL